MIKILVRQHPLLNADGVENDHEKTSNGFILLVM